MLDVRGTAARDHHARMIANEVRTGQKKPGSLDYMRVMGDTFDITFHAF